MRIWKLILVLLSLLVVISSIVIFMQVYVFRPASSVNFSSAIPPLQKWCSYEEGLTYSKYKNLPPDWKQNNKFGIYVYAENADYFEIAQNLVNSNGGQWGYVLIPFGVGDRDEQKWQRVFDQLTNKKLIPIIQLWDLDYSKYKEQTQDAANFLDKFLWPIKYRYISAYNEPNDANFWFGRVSPDEYAKVLDYTIDTFKSKNQNYFILNAGFNTSSSTNNQNMDAFEYMKQMNVKVPGIFEKLDGWASHSYPQPNFSGNPHNTGRWSIYAYDTELEFLKNVLNVKKELPVFITETGWAHAEGEDYASSFLTDDKVAEFFSIAYKEVWLPDDRVRAVTPFTITYPKPYDHFSWINKDKVPYQHYNVVKDLLKIKGKPPTLDRGELMITVCNL